MQREQFTFYRSFWDALQVLPREDRLAFIEALCSYALDGEELPLDGSAMIAFCLVKPVLNTAKRRAESGRVGGSKPKANRKLPESAPEANTKQTESEKEREKEVEREGEIENECFSIPPSSSDDEEDAPLPAAAPPPEDPPSVVGVVTGTVGVLSRKASSELDSFVRDMGSDCILRALDAARDAGKPTWAYVRGILRRKREQGVRSAADWDRLEAAHAWEVSQARDAQAREASHARGGGRRDTIAGTPRCVQPSPEQAKKSSEWLEDFLAEQEKKKEKEKGGEQASEGAWTGARASAGPQGGPETSPSRRESDRAPWPARSLTKEDKS